MIFELLTIILIPNIALMLFYKSVPNYYEEFLQKRIDRYNKEYFILDNKEIDVNRLN